MTVERDTARSLESQRAAALAEVDQLDAEISDVRAEIAKLHGQVTRDAVAATVALDRVYVGRTMPTWHGRPCRVVTTWQGRGPHNVRVEFGDGARAICPLRCTRRRST